MDTIAGALEKKQVNFFRIDGKTSPKERQEGVERFQNLSTEECQVALLSLTAASTGLTLTAASLVVFAELYWTPSILQQAEDRVHRVGQENAVQIHYVIGRGSVDEALWRMVGKKLEVLSGVVDGTASRLEVDESIARHSLETAKHKQRQLQLPLQPRQPAVVGCKRQRPLDDVQPGEELKKHDRHVVVIDHDADDSPEPEAKRVRPQR